MPDNDATGNSRALVTAIELVCMAILNPSTLPSSRHSGGRYRELDTLRRLQESLPDGYEIFHNVSLSSMHDGLERYGEIDIIVMAPSGSLLLMEVKAGAVSVRDGEIYKLYADKEHDVGRQCRIQYAAMVNRLTEAGLHPYVSSCLVLPDYSVEGSHIVSMPYARIIDAAGYDFLGSRVREFLAAGQKPVDASALRRFLNNEFRVALDLTVMGEQLRHTVRQMSDGLASWVPRIAAPSRCVRVRATAGSGKTQLAQRLLVDAAARSQAALYVCYNRALADHMGRIAPARAQVITFHEACVEHFRRKYHDPDFSNPGVFAEVTAAYLADSAHLSPRYDVLVVDEGQDFEPDWLQSLLAQLKPDGCLYVLEDDDQRLYDRDEFDLPDAVVVSCRDNFRSPALVCGVINALRLTDATVQSRNPYQGALPGFHAYDCERSLIEKTLSAVGLLLDQGFKLCDIAVLSGHGLHKSALLQLDNIGPYATRRFTGTYDRSGAPVWTDGELFVESVYRYKGQCSPAVVLAEMDCTELTRLERAKLFVGMTRAQMALEMVLSRAAEQCFANLLEG